MKQNAYLNYRPDIDGLRAIAVLSVIGFHAFPELLQGGFVGVDIFFVISGFLISTILFIGAKNGSLSFIDFYSKRIRRIFPSLIAVLSASLIYAWFNTLNIEFSKIAEHTAAGAAFFLNILLWQENGYFSGDSAFKPLLHLWSLGIEEQYYIIWPVLIYFVYKKTKTLFPLVFFLLLVSFGSNILLIDKHSVATFFLPFTRFWELLLGSLLAYITVSQGNLAELLIRWKFLNRQKSKVFNEVTAIVGLVLLVVAVFLTKKEYQFPGFWAIPPTLGSFLIIAAGRDAIINKKLLSNRVIVFFGIISYPLYLWHWPILSYSKIEYGLNLNGSITCGAVLSSVALAWLTYKFVELPARFGKRLRTKTIILFATMMIVAVLGLVGSKYDRSSSEKDIYASYFENKYPEFKYLKTHGDYLKFECGFLNIRNLNVKNQIIDSCFAASEPLKVLIWGDSHAQHLNFGLSKVKSKNISIIQVATSSCPPNVDLIWPDPFNACNKSNKFALRVISELKPDIVIMAQMSKHEETDWRYVTSKVKGLGAKHIILLGPIPQWSPNLYRVIGTRYLANLPSRLLTNMNNDAIESDRILSKKYAKSTDFSYISLIKNMCNSNGCIAFVGPNKYEDIITFDSGHLTPNGSTYVAANILMPAISKILESDYNSH